MMKGRVLTGSLGDGYGVVDFMQRGVSRGDLGIAVALSDRQGCRNLFQIRRDPGQVLLVPGQRRGYLQNLRRFIDRVLAAITQIGFLEPLFGSVEIVVGLFDVVARLVKCIGQPVDRRGIPAVFALSDKPINFE